MTIIETTHGNFSSSEEADIIYHRIEDAQRRGSALVLIRDLKGKPVAYSLRHIVRVLAE